MKIKIKLVNGYSFIGEIDDIKAEQKLRKFKVGKKLKTFCHANYINGSTGCQICDNQTRAKCQERALDYANRLADYYELIRA